MPGLRCNRAGINESRQTMSDEQPIEEIVGWPGNRHATAPTLRDALIAAVREIAATPDESETT